MVDSNIMKPEKLPSSQDQPASADPASATGLDADIQAHIGRQLRAVYDDIANEPIPDRFLQLLRELDRKREAAS